MAKLKFPFPVRVPLNREGTEWKDWSELTDEEEDRVRKAFSKPWNDAVVAHMRHELEKVQEREGE